MKVIKPARLSKGDGIGIVSPASSPADFTRINSAVKYFESNGYNVITGKNIEKSHGYLSGTDSERVEDLLSMFKNKSVKAIVCTRGGYGTPRLLDKIDYRIIRSNPKILVGYSDITALQSAIFKKTGLITFSGPMAAVDFYDEINPYAEEIFWRILTSNKKVGKIQLPENERLFEISKGSAKGRLIGGNLSLLSSLTGTEYIPDARDKILLIEEIGEAPYRIDRMLNQLRLNGILKKTKGIILGAFIDCVEEDEEKKTLTLGEVIEDYLSKLKIPVVYNFPYGHIKNLFTVPLGAQVNLNAGKHTVEITETVVS